MKRFAVPFVANDISLFKVSVLALCPWCSDDGACVEHVLVFFGYLSKALKWLKPMFCFCLPQ